MSLIKRDRIPTSKMIGTQDSDLNTDMINSRLHEALRPWVTIWPGGASSSFIGRWHYITMVDSMSDNIWPLKLPCKGEMKGTTI